MVKFKSVGYRPHLLLVEASVCAVLLPSDPDGTVSPLVLPASVPYPTGGVVPAVSDRPEFGGHPVAPTSHPSGVSGEKAARLSRYQSLALERAAASFVSLPHPHPQSIS